MRLALRYVLVGLMAVALLAGCAKQPTGEIDAAKAAIDSAVAGGAEKYAPADAKLLNDSLTAAMDEIKVQDGKFIKNYDKAKEMLAKVKVDAEALNALIPQKKEEAKNNALTAQEAAKTATAEAKKLLAKAPKGKGAAADIEAMRADLKGLEESLAEVQKLIGTEDYVVASNKATAIQEKADGISAEVRKAKEKVGKK